MLAHSYAHVNQSDEISDNSCRLNRFSKDERSSSFHSVASFPSESGFGLATFQSASRPLRATRACMQKAEACFFKHLDMWLKLLVFWREGVAVSTPKTSWIWLAFNPEAKLLDCEALEIDGEFC